MDREEFEKFFIQKAKENNIYISKEMSSKFYLYMENLIEWNSKINLTAIRDEKDIIIKHFIDSIVISKYIFGDRLLDIGSGAGFPGIPLKIVNKDLRVDLIDSVNKKVNFMNDSIEKLNLENIKAIHIRAEEIAHEKDFRESYDIVTSRAVANMSTLVEYMLPFVKIGGKCVCLKGPNCETEINASKNAIKKLGGQIGEVIEYKIEDNDRCLVIINKIKNTEQTYPRKQGKPLKEPLL